MVLEVGQVLKLHVSYIVHAGKFLFTYIQVITCKCGSCKQDQEDKDSLDVFTSSSTSSFFEAEK